MTCCDGSVQVVSEFHSPKEENKTVAEFQHISRAESLKRHSFMFVIADIHACTPRLAVVDSSSGLPQTDKLNNGWTAAVLSIGTFGMREGHRMKSRGRLDELTKLQDELKSLVRGRGQGTAGEMSRVNHLQLERLLSCSSNSKNGGIVRQSSFRKRATRAFGGFLPKPSSRETVPEMRFDEVLQSSDSLGT